MSKSIRIFSIFLIIFVVLIFLAITYKSEIYLFLKKNFYTETYQLEYSDYVEKASEEFNVPKELIYAVIKTESNFDQNAESKAGAKGLMQLLPETFSWIEMRLGETLDENMIFDPEINIRYGTYYISFLLQRLEDEEAVYAAYNAGYSRVVGWLSDTRYSADGKKLDSIPYPETSEYVKRVSEHKQNYKNILEEKKYSSQS